MITFANPASQFQSRKALIEDAILKVANSDRFILGEEVLSFEGEFSDYIGCSHSVGVGSGTDAIELALRAYDIGVGDEVITVAHTAVATVAAIVSVGATPVLVDVESDYFCLNPSLLAEALSSKTRAVIAVHLYGQAADLTFIKDFCDAHKLILIEDVAQAHGAEWNGNKLGSIGHAGCFSCYPTKNLGAIGDAGIVTTNDSNIAERLRMLREYGWRERYVSATEGRNSRMDAIQAAVLRVKLRYLDIDNKRRQKIASEYAKKITGDFGLPKIRKGSNHVFHLYIVKCRKRDQLIEFMRRNDIIAAIHYPVPIHLQPGYQNKVKVVSDMVVTKNLSETVISLPMYPEFSNVERIVSVLKDFQDNFWAND